MCVNLELEKYPGFWVQDCSASTENLLLAAHACGLGAVWVGVYPVAERVASLKQVLGLPEQVIPMCVVPIGYYTIKPVMPAMRYDETRLHYDRW